MMATSLLGSGIFVVPAVAASLAGADSLWAWLVLMMLMLGAAFIGWRQWRRRRTGRTTNPVAF
ncbi:uncharacterized membrane protein YbhN (UPF0104 family) [Oceanisphaera litoralis]|nr:hypothetical protein [Oceanisphaera litoralis]MBM7456684.1 uncharacterized membrane protein YbhN (UPF0104 family) [Oceanisphaera litoralis]